MGGDGGVIASNRKYLRGAGSAECTADAKRQRQNRNAHQEETMTTCAVSREPLDFTSKLVVCPHGLLYFREAALEALLRRKQQQGKNHEIGAHVRGLKDLHSVRFETKKNHAGVVVPVCPVTGMELNGKVPALVLVTKQNKDGPNVISERAQKEMGMEALQVEYGPFDPQDMIRLAPPASMMEEIEEKLRIKRESSKKKRKKNHDVKEKEKNAKKKAKVTNTVADAARTRVESAVKSNAVLSSLFTSEKSHMISEKEKKDNLFAR